MAETGQQFKISRNQIGQARTHSSRSSIVTTRIQSLDTVHFRAKEKKKKKKQKVYEVPVNASNEHKCEDISDNSHKFLHRLRNQKEELTITLWLVIVRALRDYNAIACRATVKNCRKPNHVAWKYMHQLRRPRTFGQELPDHEVCPRFFATAALRPSSAFRQRKKMFP